MALRVLLETVIDGVQHGDVVNARAAARALVTYLDALPPTTGSEGQVMKLAERHSTYGVPTGRAA
jgi:hypothetical protein